MTASYSSRLQERRATTLYRSRIAPFFSQKRNQSFSHSYKAQLTRAELSYFIVLQLEEEASERARFCRRNTSPFTLYQ